MILRSLSCIGTFCGTVLLSACGAGYEWSHASNLNTVAAYQEFLYAYPDDPHAADAQARITKLQEQRAWTTAQIDSSIQGYQRYLRAEPEGVHAQVAREEIVTRERDDAWHIAQTNETALSLQNFISKYPNTSEADEARDRLKVIAGYRAVVGITDSERRAERERDVLTKRFGKDLRRVYVLEPDANDREYRITSAPMSERDAGAACDSLKRAGRYCTVVQIAS